MNKLTIKKYLVFAAKLLDEVRFSLECLGGRIEDKVMDMPYPDGDSKSSSEARERYDYYSELGTELSWTLGLDDVIDQLCDFSNIDRGDLPSIREKDIDKFIYNMIKKKKLFDETMD